MKISGWKTEELERSISLKGTKLRPPTKLKKKPARTGLVLPIIVLSQFFCTSLWFAGNAVMGDLAQRYALSELALGHITSSVQFGFILGTLSFAFLTISDRFSPSRVFFFSAVAGSLFNLGIIMNDLDFTTLLSFRLFTGFFLAGIYPVGMKIAADHYEKGLGKSLGYLVGALVLGTALPHLIKDFTTNLPWRGVLIGTSTLALIGGVLMVLLVPDGPFRKPSQKPDFSALWKVFRNKPFRSAAFGYFGHMWELYSFWAFVPLMLLNYTDSHPQTALNVPLLSFFIIGIGGLSCVAAGYTSMLVGTKRTAAIALFLSGLCCLLSPLFLQSNSHVVYVAFLIFWGVMVIADSPLFSTLVAQNADSETKGTALTIVNSIGFAITIISIQLINLLSGLLPPNYLFLILGIGPLAGLIAMYKK